MATGLENLEIYKLAERLEIYVHKITATFSKEEKYRSVDQLRRSSSSVVNNIAESYGRYSYGDKINKLYIARGEAEETRKGIERACKKGFITKKINNFVNKQYKIFTKTES